MNVKTHLFIFCVFLWAASAGLSDNSPILQIRLAVLAVPGSSPPANSDKMTLRKSNRPNGQTSVEVLYVERTVLLDLKDLKTTRVVISESSGQPVIDVTFTDQGRQRFADLTRHNIDRRLAIIIDGQVHSAPVIRTEIAGGKAEINGDFNRTEAEDLSARINAALNPK